jgi:hypothetical protein
MSDEIYTAWQQHLKAVADLGPMLTRAATTEEAEPRLAKRIRTGRHDLEDEAEMMTSELRHWLASAAPQERARIKADFKAAFDADETIMAELTRRLKTGVHRGEDK